MKSRLSLDVTKARHPLKVVLLQEPDPGASFQKFPGMEKGTGPEADGESKELSGSKIGNRSSETIAVSGCDEGTKGRKER